MKIFRNCDLRQSISRARKPPSTKNQPIWSQNKKVEKIEFLTWGTSIGGQKNFFGTRDLRRSFLVPENPQVPKISQFGEEKKIFFRRRASNGTPPPFKT
jgi:hypothetical protein